MFKLNENVSRPDIGSQLSVIIACLNGSRYIADQLSALSQENPGFHWEVVVADNGSCDGSSAICESFSDRLPLKVVDASLRRGQAFARNIGVANSTGEKLLFLDQDDVIRGGYLASMSAALDGAGLVASSMEFECLNSEWAKHARGAALLADKRQGIYPWAYGCTLGVTREVFDAVGGFDEGLVCAEDMDLCWRIARDAGFEIVTVPEAVLHYRLKSTASAVFRQGVLYGRGGAALYKRWAEFGMERRSLEEAARSWIGILRRFGARSVDRRAQALYLLGNRIGCLLGSVHERVLYL